MTKMPHTGHVGANLWQSTRLGLSNSGRTYTGDEVHVYDAKVRLFLPSVNLMIHLHCCATQHYC